LPAPSRERPLRVTEPEPSAATAAATRPDIERAGGAPGGEARAAASSRACWKASASYTAAQGDHERPFVEGEEEAEAPAWTRSSKPRPALASTNGSASNATTAGASRSPPPRAPARAPALAPSTSASGRLSTPLDEEGGGGEESSSSFAPPCACAVVDEEMRQRGGTDVAPG
jgi:hypothetical protein